MAQNDPSTLWNLSRYNTGLPPSSFPTRVGLFGIGLEAYWAQFAGLEERLIQNARRVAGRLAAMGVEVVNLGLVDSPEKLATPATDSAKPMSI